MKPPEEPASPLKITRHPLGALVKLANREAWISGVVHTPEPLYELTFIDDQQPHMQDFVLHSQLELLERYPVSDKRLSEGLRQFLNTRGLKPPPPEP